MPERRPFVRLPTDVYPVNYGLRLKPDLIDFTFEGKLEAAVEVMLNLIPCSPSAPPLVWAPMSCHFNVKPSFSLCIFITADSVVAANLTSYLLVNQTAALHTTSFIFTSSSMFELYYL